ncbi:(2Fe-2S)-binding protein [Duganella sp. FT92W]|uniref:(2Fe-2S)-binding protein n=1 Tax=Pseudoduganella rivuli TaxID=2666085 RepID=A0A7X2IPK6_9BURK|nr:2Fe-2S iron-sulfur cluster-binding protein [Pseudoduganella rivuli]MRV73827.1 (2Fe-2S)-binding protein [Pseudoduganella rivuli]
MNAVAEALVEAITPQTNLNAVIVMVDGHAVAVPVGSTVVAAIAHAHATVLTRKSVSGMPRGPVCGMGICQECRVTIDGRAHQLSCQTLCEPGMDVRTAAWEGQK